MAREASSLGDAPAADPAGGDGRPAEGSQRGRLAVVGMSLSATCGVRDHATLLADALAGEGVESTFHWLTRGERSLRGSRAEIGSWIETLESEIAASRPETVLLHYSVFTASHKGVPLFVPQLLAALRRTRIPIVTMLHEFAYPWGYGGWRGLLWALSQRPALLDVMWSSSAAIVTAGSRAEWLCSRPWLPKRPVRVAPVFSTIPAPTGAAARSGEEPLVGLFGYGHQGTASSVLIDALAELRQRGLPVQLLLLGGGGAESAAGVRWIGTARERRLQDMLQFTGMLPAQALSDALAACDVLLFADAGGPSARKTTLAGSLASGRPVVAIDGPYTWAELGRQDAILLVAPVAGAVADAIAGLLADGEASESLGARGRRFSEREMGVAITARATIESIEEALSPRRG
ncbi:MAG TPA: glycosyltransferase [Solirubrobacteraceae bacterium]|nr:glycosyltransferase [Solirubrobacteraceae bacterium]